MVKQIRSIKKPKPSKIDTLSKSDSLPTKYKNPYQSTVVKGAAQGGGIAKWIFIGSTVLILLLLLGVFSPNSYEIPNSNNFGEDDITRDEGTPKISVVLYSSPTCGCCHNYVAYLNDNGFDVFQKRTEDYMDIKDENGVPQDQRSCHTAIFSDYFIEGHIPVTVVYDLLDSQLEIDGIALPGMPNGSPGMPGDKNQDWIITSILNGQVLSTFATL